MKSFTVGEVFAGIGGFGLAAERAGMVVKWQCEINDFCNKVLAKHWPNVARYRDVKEVGKHNLEPVDLICGGFPCQDVSLAGKQKGLKGKRSTLWSEFYRVVNEIRPKWIVVENVRGLLTVNDGEFFSKILRELSASGFFVEWDTLPASAFGAPHIRERIFIVANSESQTNSEHVGNSAIFSKWGNNPEKWSKDWIELVLDAGQVAPSKWKQTGQKANPQPLLVRSDDGFSNGMDRLGATGNAIVPQVAEFIFRNIMEVERITNAPQ